MTVQITAQTADAPTPPVGQSDAVADMVGRVGEATGLLKALAHDGRLLILCHLTAGERTVSELEVLLGQRQATVSQQLARLREEGLVTCRPEGKSRRYSIADPRAARVVGVLYDLFCDG